MYFKSLIFYAMVAFLFVFDASAGDFYYYSLET